MKLSDIPEWEAIDHARAWSASQCTTGVVDALAARYPAKLALRKVERMIDLGFLNCGVSPYYAWAEPESRWPRRPTGEPTTVATKE